MVRSTLLCRLSRWARRASCRVQRKCIFRKYLRPRCLHYVKIFQKSVPPAKSKEYEALEKCIQNDFWNIFTWEFIRYWASSGVAKRHFSGEVQNMQNLSKIISSGCFVCFLLVNGAKHSLLIFWLMLPEGWFLQVNVDLRLIFLF